MRVFGYRSRSTRTAARVRFRRKMGGALVALCALFVGMSAFGETPAVGAKAPDFTLSTPTGKTVTMLGEQRGHGLVLVVLRGFPGYQCPYCVKQVHDFVDHASDFAAKGTRVLLVYPGPPADLDQHAREFLEKQAELPSNIVLVTDPDYKMTISRATLGCTSRDGIPVHVHSRQEGDHRIREGQPQPRRSSIRTGRSRTSCIELVMRCRDADF